MGRQRSHLLRPHVLPDGDLVTKRAPSRAPRSNTERRPASLTAGKFPALAAFLKGYLHQDFPEEHGSVSAAVAAFCRDASAEERGRLAAELARLLAQAKALPSSVVGRFVTRDLGSAWSPGSTSELADILSARRKSR